MFEYWLHHKKIKFYLLILAVLWSAAFINSTTFNRTTGRLHFTQRAVDALDRETSTVLYTKVYAGQLTLAQKDKIAAKLLSSYGAEEISAIKTEKLFTIYAYSDRYNSCVTVEGQPINLNLVYYYNEINKETTLILATPIYNEDY